MADTMARDPRGQRVVASERTSSRAAWWSRTGCFRGWAATLLALPLLWACSVDSASNSGVEAGGGGSTSTGGPGAAGGGTEATGGSAAGGGDVSLESESGTFEHGASVSLSGRGFGDKTSAAPWRASYHHPEAAQRFQESGIFEGGWGVAGEANVSLDEGISGARVVGRDSHRYSVRMEYSAQGNWDNGGYSAGVQTDLPESKVIYLAWWEKLEAGFDASHMETGSANYKWLYNSPGQAPHQAFQVADGGTTLHVSFSGGVGGSTDAEQEANLDLPFGGGFYARPISFRTGYGLPVDRWYFVELYYSVNSGVGVFDGWGEMRVDNQRIYRADHVDYLDSGEPNPYFPYFRFGGNYGFDDSGEVYYRQYGDLYIDSSFARVLIGDAPSYPDCSHVEVQVPTAWSDDEVRFTLNHGSFATSDVVYVYLVDADQQLHGPVELELE